MSETIWETQRLVEAELAQLVGRKKFSDFKTVLKQLVAIDGQTEKLS